MPSDAMQRIKQLERMVATLSGQVELMRTRSRSSIGSIEPVMVKTIGAIAGVVASGSGFTVTYADAELWDISRVTSSSANMLGVVDGSDPVVKRVVKLGNPWVAEAPATTFMLAVPYKGNYIITAVECEVPE